AAPAQPPPTAPANAPVAAAPAAAPKLDRAAVATQLAALTTATEAVKLGDAALADTGDAALAESCFEKALELEPANAEAKRKLDVRPFDPKTEFPGFDDVVGTPETFMIQGWLDRKGQPLSRAARAAELARWNDARKGIEARVAEADADPFLTRIDKTRTEIANLPYFKDLNYD